MFNLWPAAWLCYRQQGSIFSDTSGGCPTPAALSAPRATICFWLVMTCSLTSAKLASLRDRCRASPVREQRQRLCRCWFSPEMCLPSQVVISRVSDVVQNIAQQGGTIVEHLKEVCSVAYVSTRTIDIFCWWCAVNAPQLSSDVHF